MHRFVSNVVPFILSIEQKKFVLVEYSVSPEEFVISVNYDKSLFEHKINEFVCDIIKEAQKSDLDRHHWAGQFIGHCENIGNSPDSYFFHSVIINFTVF